MGMYSLSTVIFPELSVEEMISRMLGAGFRCAEFASEKHAEEFMKNPGRIGRQFERAGIRLLGSERSRTRQLYSTWSRRGSSFSRSIRLARESGVNTTTSRPVLLA